MSVSKGSGNKKRRAPLPEEIYPSLVKEASNLVNDSPDDGGTTSTERMPRILPPEEPVRTL